MLSRVLLSSGIEAIPAMRGLSGRIGGVSPAPSLTLYQFRVAENPQENNSLQRLTIYHYTLQNIYYELMYLKKKFVNLESLQLVNQLGLFWSPITEM